jgi:hypothetical protein
MMANPGDEERGGVHVSCQFDARRRSPAVNALLAAALAAISFGAVAVAYRAAPERIRRRDPSAVVTGLVIPVAWATLLPLHPTGLVLWDVALAATWTAVVAVLAANVERRVLLVLCLGVAAAAVIGGAGLLPAALAFGLAGCAAALGIRLPGPKALAGGLVAVALLQLDWPAPTGSRTAIAAVVLGTLAMLARRRAAKPARRRVTVAVGVVALAAVAIGAVFGLTALRVRDDLRAAVDVARTGLRAAEDGSMQDASSALDRAQARFVRADRRLDAWYVQPARLVPGLARNHRAMTAITASGSTLATQAAKVAHDGDADDVRLRDGTLDLARVDRLRMAVTEITGQLTVAGRALDRAASAWPVPELDDALTDMRAEVADATRSTATTAQITRRLPALLGGDGPRHWFVGVLGNSEARATGGIIGSSGVLTTDGGHLDLGPMQRTAELNTAGDRTLVGVDDYVARYGRYEPQRTWQNVTMSPDGPSVGRVVEQLYPQSTGQPVDGVVLVDPFGLAALVRLVGPVRVDSWPTDITAASLPEILLHDQYLAFDRPERLDFLGDVASAAFDELTTGVLPPPARIAAVLAPAVAGHHLVLHSTHDSEQDLFADLRVDGAMPPVHGDALAVVTQNASGNKIDWFLRRSVDYDVTVSRSGVARADLSITLMNTAPANGEPDYVIAGSGPDPTPPGVNRMIVSVYSPLDLDDATIDLEREHELGRNVYTGFVTVPPGGTTTIELSLRGRLSMRDGYRIDVREQATVVPDDVAITVNGRSYR